MFLQIYHIFMSILIIVITLIIIARTRTHRSKEVLNGRLKTAFHCTAFPYLTSFLLSIPLYRTITHQSICVIYHPKAGILATESLLTSRFIRPQPTTIMSPSERFVGGVCGMFSLDNTVEFLFLFLVVSIDLNAIFFVFKH